MKRDGKPAATKKDITLRDVVRHIQGVKQGLQKEIRELRGEVKEVNGNLHGLERRVEEGFREAKEHREAPQEDLVATMRDIVSIRRHVGLPVPSE